MRSTTRYFSVVFFAFGGLASFAIHFPLVWALAIVEAFTGLTLPVKDAGGSLFRGYVALAPPAASPATATDVSLVWSAALDPGLTSARIVWRAPCCMVEPSTLELPLGHATGRWQLVETALNIPSEIISVYFPMLGSHISARNISVSIAGLRGGLTKPSVTAGEIQTRIRGASTRLAGSVPLGDYLIRSQFGKNSTIDFDLTTERGILKITGDGRLGGRVLSAKVVFSAESENLRSVEHLLNILGKRRGNESIYQIRMTL